MVVLKCENCFVGSFYAPEEDKKGCPREKYLGAPGDPLRVPQWPSGLEMGNWLQKMVVLKRENCFEGSFYAPEEDQRGCPREQCLGPKGSHKGPPRWSRGLEMANWL